MNSPRHVSVPADKGASARLKANSLIPGWVAGGDSIDDMALLRHIGMGRVFGGAYAPSTPGSYLRAFTFSHMGQLHAVAYRLLAGPAAHNPLITGSGEAGGRALVGIDDINIGCTATPSRARGTATPKSAA